MYSIYVHIYMCKCVHTYSLTEWFQRYLYMDIHCNNLTQNNWKQTKNLLMGIKQTSSVTQSTLWDPKDYNPPGSSVHRILKARILEWVAISFSRGSSWRRAWQPIPVFVPGESHGQRSLVGCSHKELDTTEWLSTYTYIVTLLGIIPTQGSNPGLLHCRRILYHLSHQGSPKQTLKSLPSSKYLRNVVRLYPKEEAFGEERNTLKLLRT